MPNGTCKCVLDFKPIWKQIVTFIFFYFPSIFFIYLYCYKKMDRGSVSQGPATKCTVRDSLSGSLQPSPWLQSHASTCNLVSRASKYDISSEIRSILLLRTDPVRQLVAQIADLNVIHAVQISGASAPGGTKSAPVTGAPISSLHSPSNHSQSF